MQVRNKQNSFWGSVLTTPEEIKNGDFSLKKHQVFSVDTTPQQSPAILDLCLRETWSGISRDYRDVIVFEKFRFQNFSRWHENAKPAFSNSSGLKSVLEKLTFRDGLVWTASLAIKIKLRFQISLAWCGQGRNVEVSKQNQKNSSPFEITCILVCAFYCGLTEH